MAMTAMVKDELSRVECTKTSERKAEVTALLRFSGGLHIVGGRVVIEAELDTGSVARRLRRDISEVYGYTSGVSVLAGGNIRRGVRYLVRIAKHGEGLARQTGLVDQRGRPVRGLPPSVVSGSINDAEAAWRGAFLAHGSLTEPGRSSSLEVTCPGPEAAMALLGPRRGGRQRPGGAGAGDPRGRRPRAPAGRWAAAPRARSGLAGGARPARRPADDQGRRRRPDTASAGHGRQA